MTSLDRGTGVRGAGVPGTGRAARAGAPRWRAFALLAAAYFMTAVDLTIVNVALPTIGRRLHFAESDLQWVVTAYALTFGGFMLLGGRAADLLGRKRVFLAGLATFSAASLGCALATSGTFLIVLRGIQGLGAAAVLPAVVFLLARGAVPESRLRPDGPRGMRRYDPLGAVSVTAALVIGVYSMSQAPAAGWTAARTLALLATSAVLLAAFLVLEARAKAPLPTAPATAD